MLARVRNVHPLMGTTDPIIVESLGRFHLVAALPSDSDCERFDAVSEADGHVIVVTPRDRRDEASRALFLAEFGAARGVRHPRIQQVIDVGTDADVPYAALAIVRGVSLAEHVRDLGPNDRRIEADDAVLLMVDVLDELGAAHAMSQPVWHRDVSPLSVWIDAGRGVLTGLGLGTFATRSRLRPACRGTAALAPNVSPWLAPELLIGGGIDHRVDVYGAGALLYWMLTGRHAFAGCSEMEKLESIVRRVPARPVLLRRGVPPMLSDVAMTALEKDPARRFGSVAVMREAVLASYQR